MSELLDTIPAETTQTDRADGSIFLPEGSDDTNESSVTDGRPSNEEIAKARRDLENLFTGTPKEVARAEKLYREGRREIGKGTEAEAFYIKCERLADVANRAYDRPAL